VYSVPGFESEWFWDYWKDPTNIRQNVVDFMKENYPPSFTYDFVYSSKNKCERYYKQFQLDISYDIQLYFTYFAPEALNMSAHSSGL
jgi:hypothetical protein